MYRIPTAPSIYSKMKSLNRITILSSLLLGILIATPTISFAKAKPRETTIVDGVMELITLERKEDRLRQAIASAFRDIIYSPTIVSQKGYMEIDLEPNEIITKENCFVAIYFGKKGTKTIFNATAFEIINGQRIKVTDRSVMLGTQLILEGVVKELDYRYEIANGRYAGLSEFEILKSKTLHTLTVPMLSASTKKERRR